LFRLKQTAEAASLTWRMGQINVGEILAVVMPIVVLVGGVGITILALRGRQRLKELAFQERIAMIEKGLVPSPESDPAGFESAMARRAISPRALRYRSAGLVLTGMGMALMILLLFVMPAAVRGVAVGVGGAMTVLGLTILGNGLLLARDDMEGSARNTAPRG
jgi:hypothetical protein